MLGVSLLSPTDFGSGDSSNAASGNAHCACGELRQASLAPGIFEKLQRDLFDGEWFLVFSKTSKHGNDDGLQGTCVPSRLSVPAVEDDGSELPAHLEDMDKLPGSFMRVQKMRHCLQLVEEEEQRRGAAFATVTFSRPDILTCGEITAPESGSLQPGQMVTWGEEWFGEMGQDMHTPEDILHDYIFTLERRTAQELVEGLHNDIMGFPEHQSDWTDSLSAACPSHHDIAVKGDATLECLLARRLRASGWQASTKVADFTLVRAGYSSCETRCGSDSCKSSAKEFVASDDCMTRSLFDYYKKREGTLFRALRERSRDSEPQSGKVRQHQSVLTA